MSNLFAQDNHAPDSPQFFDVDDDVSTMVRRVLSDQFAVSIDRSCSVLSIGRVNINSHNYRIGDWYLKLFPHSNAPQNQKRSLDFFPELASRLAANSIPVAPFISTRTGDRIALAQSGMESQLCFLQYFMEGTFFTGSREHFVAACDLLLRLRGAAGLAELQSSQWKPFRSLNLNEQIETVYKQLRADPQPQLQLLIPFAERFSRIAQRFHEVFAILDSTLLHHLDLHPHNLLFREDRPVAVLDLESFRAMPYELSLAFGVFKLARKAISMGRLGVEELRTLLRQNIYEHYSVELLLPLAQGELLRRLLLIADLNLTGNDHRWNGDINKHLSGLDEAEVIFGR